MRDVFLKVSNFLNSRINIFQVTYKQLLLKQRHLNLAFLPCKAVSKNSIILSIIICPLVLMCHSCIENNEVNSLHEMCLRLIYTSKQFSFHGLLDRTSSVSLHKGNRFFHCNIELWNRIESLISVPPLNFFQKIFQPLSLLLGKSQTTFLSCLFLFNCIMCNVFICIIKL